MKKVYFGAVLSTVIALACFLWYGCTKDVEETKGSIYGFVTDKATGEAVANANVILLTTNETMLTATLTGSDGTYEFTDVSNGKYRIKVTKTGYTDLVDNYVIEVSDGKKARRDVQIEKLPMALRIVDANGADISVLDFGAEADVTSRTFSIFNDSPGKIRWWIADVDCGWITEVKSVISGNSGGDLEAGQQEPIKVTIDRSQLGSGRKTYILNINSDKGSRELTITAGEDVGLPSLTTDPVSNLTQTSVTFNGTIINEGAPAYHERGFVYSTSAQPTIDNNAGRVTSAQNGQAIFSNNVSGLSANASYYVRAYAINTIGVAYGNDVAFTTGSVLTELSTSAATNVTATSATLNATIIVEGSPAYTERGFCYSTSTNPTISHNKIVVSGSGVGAYSTDVNSLTYPVTYHVRAYAIQNGQPRYGNDITFSTSGTGTQVQTSAPSSITATSATFNGSIVEEGSPAYTEKGFCYSTSSNPTISNNKVIVSGTGSGPYSKNVSGLALQTTYYVRAYAMQNGQPVYGNALNFETVWVDAEVQTSAVTNITSTTAKFNGVVTNAGTPNITEKGFCYSTTNPNPTISNTKVVVSGTGTGNYNKSMTGLTEGETYYVRAYVMQNGTAIYGNSVQFSTDEMPVVYTNDVSNLTPVSSAGIILSWNVTFNGSIGSVGSPAYVERGFCYGTSMNPTGNRQVVAGNGTGDFSKTITGLQNYQTYYVRAYAKTASGTYVYGQNVSFQTYDW